MGGRRSARRAHLVSSRSAFWRPSRSLYIEHKATLGRRHLSGLRDVQGVGSRRPGRCEGTVCGAAMASPSVAGSDLSRPRDIDRDAQGPSCAAVKTTHPLEAEVDGEPDPPSPPKKDVRAGLMPKRTSGLRRPYREGPRLTPSYSSCTVKSNAAESAGFPYGGEPCL